MAKTIALYGATGSVGQSTVDLVRRQPSEYRFSVLTANTDVEAMASLIDEFQPDLAIMADPKAARALAQLQTGQTRILGGMEALVEGAYAPYDVMVAAIVGAAGLTSTLAAVEQGRTVALANKEALVCAGDLMMSAAERSSSLILPVDSEHNAIFQCWEERNRPAIRSIQLTGSGGPFRGWTAQQVRNASLEQALKHPNWSMGTKITIDSATLMNKALEMIEAKWLFDVSADQIEVVIHPQSIIHSCVTYADGSTLAQLGKPDMRTPLAYCLAYPERAPMGGDVLSLSELGALTFEQPDLETFPALGLAKWALQQSSSAAAIALNAANEVKNEAVREMRLPFGELVPQVEAFLTNLDLPEVHTLNDILEFDAEVRTRSAVI